MILSLCFVNLVTGVHINNIEARWAACKATIKRLKMFCMFVDELCYEVVGTFRRSPRVLSRRVSDASDHRLFNESSVPIHIAERAAGASSNNRCVVHYKQAKRTKPGAKDSQLPKRSKTVYRCTACDVFLCIGSGLDNCFSSHHSKVQYWR